MLDMSIKGRSSHRVGAPLKAPLSKTRHSCVAVFVCLFDGAHCMNNDSQRLEFEVEKRRLERLIWANNY